MEKSRNEKILENILGAQYEILPPFSRIEKLLLQLSEKLDGVPSEPITSNEITEITEGV